MLVALAAAASLAGCAGVRPARDDADPVSEAFDGGPDRPECDVESETVEVRYGDDTREMETAATIPYPEPPTGLDAGSVLEYVVAFEEAYVTHDVLCDADRSGEVFSIGYGVQRSETFDRGGSTTVYLLRVGGASSGTDSEGNAWEADIGYGNVTYAVDETGAARVEFDGAPPETEAEIRSESPDPPSEGTFVASFE